MRGPFVCSWQENNHACGNEQIAHFPAKTLSVNLGDVGVDLKSKPQGLLKATQVAQNRTPEVRARITVAL
jgi:hypothetical protein